MGKKASLTSAANAPQPRSNKRMLLILGLVLFVVLCLGTSGYFFLQYKNAQSVLGKSSSDDVEGLVKEIGAVIELPQGEVPTVAIVSDKSKLSGQAFFRKAENGDKVLIFANAKRAILYRPSVKRIIDVTTIDLNESANSGNVATPSATSAIAPVKVVIYNGTKVAGLAAKGESSLKAEDSGVVVASKMNSSMDYEDTLVVDLSGKNKVKAEAIAKHFEGKVGNIPAEEARPDADILLILGASFAN